MTDISQFIVDLIFQPGSSLKLVPAINVSILLLLITITLLSIYNKHLSSIHVFVMATLALGLLFSVNW